MRAARKILYLGIKELRSLLRDPILLGLIAFAFTVNIYTAATAVPETLHNAPIVIVDEDRSALSRRIADAFQEPYFLPPALITPTEMDARMDAGLDTFALQIPSRFQRDVLAGRNPALQLNVDATRMSQAFNGSRYIQVMVLAEVNEFLRGHRVAAKRPVELALRTRFNPELNKVWFGAVMEVISGITMLAIVLTGASLIREREHGTVEHLLVMPVTPFEIMSSKVWAMALGNARDNVVLDNTIRGRARAALVVAVNDISQVATNNHFILERRVSSTPTSRAILVIAPAGSSL